MSSDETAPVWIPEFRDERGLPWPQFDDKNSIVQSYEFLGTEQLVHPNDVALLKLPRHSKGKSLAKFQILPAIRSVLLVRGEILDIMKSLPSGEVDFTPTRIACKDDEVVEDFVFARPLNRVACTDFEKSDVDFDPKLKSYSDWRKIVFFPGCLGSLSFARETYNKRMIMSDALKRQIEAVAPRGLHFFLSEEFEPMAGLLVKEPAER